MKKLLLIISCFIIHLAFSQEVDTLKVAPQTVQDIERDIQMINKPLKITPNSPVKAGLYSAVLPGLGQYYNKKYWKIPIVWGGIGTGVGIVLWNQRKYDKYRSAFIAELNGQPHEFSGFQGVNEEVLGRIQDKFKRQRDYAIAITGLIYVLNIIDAVVDAHLYEMKRDPDLTLKPTVIYDEYAEQNAKAGISLSFRF
ncbi:MAG: DUF5683 domain-containing protein [Bergeyella cardium]